MKSIADKIIEKKIEEVVPYENNPRNNDKAVKFVANSIKQFGFKVPIIIDKNGVIVAGLNSTHARIHHQVSWENCVPKILNEKWKK